MALITIGTYDLPTPSEFSVGIMDLSRAERNAKGELKIDRIATKRKIEMQWDYLSRTDLQSILNAVSPIFFTVYYMDPLTNATRQGTFYSGDRTAGMMDFINGVPRYRGVKFNLIEK